jgi:hypothetical protein
LVDPVGALVDACVCAPLALLAPRLLPRAEDFRAPDELALDREAVLDGLLRELAAARLLVDPLLLPEPPLLPEPLLLPEPPLDCLPLLGALAAEEPLDPFADERPREVARLDDPRSLETDI